MKALTNRHDQAGIEATRKAIRPFRLAVTASGGKIDRDESNVHQEEHPPRWYSIDSVWFAFTNQRPRLLQAAEGALAQAVLRLRYRI
ncbi:hypothetical protein A2721_02820 [Candidatus Gottesmanbacteria bacterium RIFCSPHIGHO2_01_FULL_47_48]|uniref:Uncharacterized protein n=1 Tax=Candidatus Gottesmanbacteria bacterium RIFCSPHIGHO2_01_FULL_47_48 TaxID=1798381 RepID=A0A1F6A4K0_9BACT|nr:MAG: hypothetical protein A2721_02820 [Candidatus Gottesmanbacteria bacterium RIFCSPHIGHO2_01_FULL_47_48]